MTTTAIAVGILALAALVVVLLLARSARGRRRAAEDVPPGMRPAYSDEQLEQTLRNRYLAWGGALTVLLAVFLPVYWVQETRRLQAETQGFFAVAVAEGGDLFVENCAECHGAEGQGGAAPSPYGEGTWPAPNLTTMAARYVDSVVVEDLRRYIVTTIERGRNGTPMPEWGAAYGGPLTDQQVEDITDWILANQVPLEAETEEAAATEVSGQELFVESCVKCHGENGRGRVGPSLVGVFERHNEETVLGILRNGISLNVLTMPPWQNGFMYEGTRYSDEQLQSLVDYMRELQPAQLPGDAGQYSTPGVGPAPEQAEAEAEADVEAGTDGNGDEETGQDGNTGEGAGEGADTDDEASQDA